MRLNKLIHEEYNKVTRLSKIAVSFVGKFFCSACDRIFAGLDLVKLDALYFMEKPNDADLFIKAFMFGVVACARGITYVSAKVVS